MDDLFKELNAVFKRYTGKPLTMIVYELNELHKRVGNIEDTIKVTMPVMAATTLKVEAIIDCMEINNVTTRAAIDSCSKKFLTTVNSNVLK